MDPRKHIRARPPPTPEPNVAEKQPARNLRMVFLPTKNRFIRPFTDHRMITHPRIPIAFRPQPRRKMHKRIGMRIYKAQGMAICIMDDSGEMTSVCRHDDTVEENGIVQHVQSQTIQEFPGTGPSPPALPDHLKILPIIRRRKPGSDRKDQVAVIRDTRQWSCAHMRHFFRRWNRFRTPSRAIPVPEDDRINLRFPGRRMQILADRDRSARRNVARAASGGTGRQRQRRKPSVRCPNHRQHINCRCFGRGIDIVPLRPTHGSPTVATHRIQPSVRSMTLQKPGTLKGPRATPWNLSPHGRLVPPPRRGPDPR